MAPRNGSGFAPPPSPIEAAEGVTTGIPQPTARAPCRPQCREENAQADDIVSPGHIFPLMAQAGAAWRVRAIPEAQAGDLARMGGFEPSGVICETNDDGTMSRRPELEVFAAEHGIKIGTIADLIHYRLMHERTVGGPASRCSTPSWASSTW